MENFEIQQNHPDIQYSLLVYQEIDSLLNGNEEFEFEKEWEQVRNKNSILSM